MHTLHSHRFLRGNELGEEAFLNRPSIPNAFLEMVQLKLEHFLKLNFRDFKLKVLIIVDLFQNLDELSMDDLAKILLLIDPNIDYWLLRKTFIEKHLQASPIHSPAESDLTLFQQLLSHMAKNFAVREYNMSYFSRLISIGYIRECLDIIENNPSFFHTFSIQNFLYETIYNCVFQNNSFFSNNSDFDVVTGGLNEAVSLGNPLGTSSCKKISIDPNPLAHSIGRESLEIKDVWRSVYQIGVGPSTTIYIGYTQDGSVRKDRLFVSGHFGDQHFVLPKLVSLQNETFPALFKNNDIETNTIECFAIGNSHLLIFCGNIYYAIGDNSNNQLGLGANIPFLNKLAKCTLPRLIRSVLSCSTSNNHTVILTTDGYFVCGTNVGQMGDYAAIYYQDPPPPTKIPQFTKLTLFTTDFEEPNNLLQIRSSRMAISDYITVIFGKSRVKIFFEYKTYSITIDHGNNCIVNASIFKSRGSTGRVYMGSISMNEDMQIACKVEPMKEIIGYVKKAVISSDGKNRGFLVHRGQPISFEKNECELPSEDKRIKLLEMAQAEGRKSNEKLESFADDQIYTICAKTKKFYAHKFILKLRVPQLYRKANDNWQIDLKGHQDNVVWELLEFIYFNNSTSIKMFIDKELVDFPELSEKMHDTFHGLLCLASLIQFDQLTELTCSILANLDNANYTCTFPPYFKGNANLNTIFEKDFVDIPSEDKRIKLLEKAQKQGSKSIEIFENFEENLIDQIYTIFSKSKRFYAHKFILKLRVPHLLRKANDNREINLKEHRDNVVWELLEFIYFNNSKTIKLFAGKELVDVPEMFDKMQRTFKGLFCLASLIKFNELIELSRSILENLENTTYTCVFPSYFNENANLNTIFEKNFIEIICDDGTINYSRALIRHIEYFDAYYRWNTDSKSITFKDVSMECMNIVLKFILSRNIEEKDLSIEQMIELMFFADKYMMPDLMDRTLDLLEFELNFCNLDLFFKLMEQLNYYSRFEEILLNFAYSNLPIIFCQRREILKKFSDKSLQICLKQFSLYNTLNLSTCNINHPELDEPLVEAQVSPEIHQKMLLLKKLYFEDPYSKVDKVILPAPSSEEDITEMARNKYFKEENILGINDSDEFEDFLQEDEFLTSSCKFQLIHEMEKLSTENAKNQDLLDINLKDCSIESPESKRRRGIGAEGNVMEEEEENIEGENSMEENIPEEEENVPSSSKAIQISSNFQKDFNSSNLSWTSSGYSFPSTSKSLFEIMNEESKLNKQQSPKRRHPKMKFKGALYDLSHPIPIKKCENEFSWQNLSAPSSSPLQTFGAACNSNNTFPQITNTSPQTKSLREIQEDEIKQQNLAILQSRKKPLQILEIEERAIQELEEYYRQIYGDGNAFIVVKRQEGNPLVDPSVLFNPDDNPWQSGNSRKLF